MKKRLEAELISIAHRVLKLKNKSEIDQLYLETRKLYETLSVLKFYGDNYEQLKSEITIEDLEEKLSSVKEDINPIEFEINPIEVVSEDSIAETIAEIEVVEEVDSVEENNEIEEVEDEIEEEESFIEESDNNEEEFPETDLKEINFEPIFELATEAPIEDLV